MSSLRVVALSRLWAALDHCLPGYRRLKKTHHWWLYHPDGATVAYRVPLGRHGRRRDEDVEIGHVRKAARQLGVLDCVMEFIEGL